MVCSGCSSAAAEIHVILHLGYLKLHNSSVIADNIRRFFTHWMQREFQTDSLQFSKTNYPVICLIAKLSLFCFLSN
jgi:hypothetical protein